MVAIGFNVDLVFIRLPPSRANSHHRIIDRWLIAPRGVHRRFNCRLWQVFESFREIKSVAKRPRCLHRLVLSTDLVCGQREILPFLSILVSYLVYELAVSFKNRFTLFLVHYQNVRIVLIWLLNTKTLSKGASLVARLLNRWIYDVNQPAWPLPVALHWVGRLVTLRRLGPSKAVWVDRDPSVVFAQ